MTTEFDEVKTEIESSLAHGLTVLADELNRQYDDEVAELDKEAAGLAVEYAGITAEQEKLGAVLPSLSRIAETESDRLIVAGDLRAAEVKIAEVKEARAIPVAMEQKKKAISDRYDRIPEEKVAIARKIYEAMYPEMQNIVRAAETGFVCLLDGLARSAEDFQRRTGTAQNELLRLNRMSQLTGDEKSPEWESLSRRWYGRR